MPTRNYKPEQMVTILRHRWRTGRPRRGPADSLGSTGRWLDIRLVVRTTRCFENA